METAPTISQNFFVPQISSLLQYAQFRLFRASALFHFNDKNKPSDDEFCY